MKFSFWCSLLFIVYSITSIGQISVMPLMFYSPWALCTYAKPYGRTPNFRANSDASGGSYGIFLKLVPITSKISLYTGIYNGSLSWGYKFFFPPGRSSAANGTGTFIYYFPVFVNLFDYKIGGNKNSDNDTPAKRSLHFKTYAGFAFDFVPYNQSYFNSGDSLNINVNPSNTSFYFNEHVNLITNKGASVMGACSLYLYNNIKKRESLSLSVFYWQGLVNLISIDVPYIINGTSYYAKLYSRATSVDFAIAYSINIDYKNWFSGKRKNDTAVKP